MRDLKPSDKGRKFTATFRENKVEGKIQYENGEFFLCQNKRCGKTCLDKLGYSYSYTVENGTVERLYRYGVTDMEFLSMTAQGIEDYKDFKIGDVLISKENRWSYNREVIAIIEDEIVITKDKDGTEDLRMNTKDKLHQNGWRLKYVPEEEPIVELSVAEVASRLGVNPKTLKIVDK
jgi:hypothetical protein